MNERAHFTPDFFKFLRDLDKHNNREWFQENKWRYEEFVRDPFLHFIEDFRPRLHAISPHFIADPKPSGGSLLRIYRDMRFRKGQAPYQTMAAARFPHRAGKERTAPGLYLHLDPSHCFFACGLWHPDGDTRARVRAEILRDSGKWKRGTRRKTFQSIWQMSGDSFKRPPPGIDSHHPLATDLMRKDFIAAVYFSEQQVCATNFLSRITKATRAAAPFLEFLTRGLGLPWTVEDRSAPREILRVEVQR
jgi:uncharacterized protein (TIGR02453 family)